MKFFFIHFLWGEWKYRINERNAIQILCVLRSKGAHWLTTGDKQRFSRYIFKRLLMYKYMARSDCVCSAYTYALVHSSMCNVGNLCDLSVMLIRLYANRSAPPISTIRWGNCKKHKSNSNNADGFSELSKTEKEMNVRKGEKIEDFLSSHFFNPKIKLFETKIASLPSKCVLAGCLSSSPFLLFVFLLLLSFSLWHRLVVVRCAHIQRNTLSLYIVIFATSCSTCCSFLLFSSSFFAMCLCVAYSLAVCDILMGSNEYTTHICDTYVCKCVR